MEISAPRGTFDILPEDAGLWQYVESLVRTTFENYGYREIRTPMFEHTELFERGVGETTDIVEKEMYTFKDRGDRLITLRPEGTASVVRAYVGHRLSSRPQPTKMYYIGPMFRYERPQAGRYRQFHQFGVECIGVEGPAADAEVISMPLEIYRALGISGIVVNLNSIGCPECRPAYREALREAYRPVLGVLCPSCVSRYDRNPLRLLDCKSEECRAATPEPPQIFSYLCPACRGHFDELKRRLDKIGVEYVINPRLVRGLDYYTRTTFEYNLSGIGSQDALGGGGRYDGLVEECGGQHTPAVGLACGLERLVIALKARSEAEGQGEGQGELEYGPRLDVFFVSMGDAAREAAFELAFKMRAMGVSADFDMIGRGLKAQMRYADKLRARYVAIIGDDELASGQVTLKDMSSGEQTRVAQEALSRELLCVGA